MSTTTEQALAIVKIRINPADDPKYIALRKEIEDMCAYIGRCVVDSPTAVKRITEDVNLAQKVAAKVEALRKEYKDPLNKYGKDIDAVFKDLSSPISDARGSAADKIKEFNRQQREKQRLIDEENARRAREAAELQRLIDEENERLRQEAEDTGSRTVDEEGTITEQVPIEYIQPEPEPELLTPEPTVSKVATDLGSATEKMVPRFKLVDIKSVPVNLLLLNEKAVNGLLKAGIRDIEGLEIWEEPEIDFRRK